jgi:hypothetical protein
VRFLLGLALAALGTWLLLRRRTSDGPRVVVGWEDGSELELGQGSKERERLVTLAQAALP